MALSPFDRYVTFLSLIGYSPSRIADKLLQVGYPQYSGKEIIAIRRSVLSSLPPRDRNKIRAAAHERISSPIHRRLSVLFDRLGVLELWMCHTGKFPSMSVETTCKQLLLLAEDREYRLFVECLLLARAEYPVISEAIRMRYRVEIPPAPVGAFERIFWDVSSMSRSAFRRFLSERYAADDEVVKLYETALYQPLEQVLWDLGLLPNVPSEDMLKEILTGAYFTSIRGLRGGADQQLALRAGNMFMRGIKTFEEIKSQRPLDLAESIHANLKKVDIKFPSFRGEFDDSDKRRMKESARKSKGRRRKSKT